MVLDYKELRAEYEKKRKIEARAWTKERFQREKEELLSENEKLRKERKQQYWEYLMAKGSK